MAYMPLTPIFVYSFVKELERDIHSPMRMASLKRELLVTIPLTQLLIQSLYILVRSESPDELMVCGSPDPVVLNSAYAKILHGLPGAEVAVPVHHGVAEL